MHSSIGIGLRAPHYQTLLAERPDIGWLEVHSENYFEPHSRAFHVLNQLADHYPIGLHGVGMSLGSSDRFLHVHIPSEKRSSGLNEPRRGSVNRTGLLPLIFQGMSEKM